MSSQKPTPPRQPEPVTMKDIARVVLVAGAAMLAIGVGFFALHSAEANLDPGTSPTKGIVGIALMGLGAVAAVVGVVLTARARTQADTPPSRNASNRRGR